MTLIFMLILALVPSLFWLLLLIRKDYREPEPIGLLFKIFVRGVIFAIPLTVILGAVTDQYFVTSPTNESEFLWLSFVTMFLVVAPIEEYVKFWTAKKVVNKPKNEKQFSQIVDGIIYMAVAASAFAFVENLGYFYDAKITADSLGLSPILSWEVVMQRFGVRAVATTLMHLVSSGVLGYFWGRARFGNPEKPGNHLYYGFGIAVLIHGFFNFTIDSQATTNYELGLFPLVIAVAGLVFLYSRFSGAQNTEIHEDPTAEALLRRDGLRPSAVISVMLVLLLLGAGYVAYRGAVNEFATDRSYYYSVSRLSPGIVIATQVSSEELCETVRNINLSNTQELTLESYKCDGSIEINNTLRPLFNREAMGFPYLAFVEERGHEVRVFITADFDWRTIVESLMIMQLVAQKVDPSAELIAPY